MALHVKDDGIWKPVAHLHVRDAGIWKPVKNAFVRQAGAWSRFYASEVVVTITAHTAQANVQSYFTAADWADPLLDKRLIIAPGVHVWSYTPSVPGLSTGTGRGGKLTIENNGYILGAGGAPNSGVGGTALLVQQSGVYLINNLGIYGGGGGGGRGGTGGGGVYATTDRPAYSSSNYWYCWGAYKDNDYDGRLVFNGAYVYHNVSSAGFTFIRDTTAPIVSGIYTYTKGTKRLTDTGSLEIHGWDVVRTYNTNTNGGAGGNGGPGYGYNSALLAPNVAGTPGAAGGTNAGAGGAGGSGGNSWGRNGSPGATGAAGNRTAGLAGASGGLAGFYISGYGLLESFNGGNLAGRYN